jgi:Family of unknown function (DUF6152)
MENKLLQRVLATGSLALALLCGATAAWAHHAIQAKFDVSKTTQLSGIVTYVDWRNPHAHVFMNVTSGAAANRTVLNWAVELESPVELEMDGWKNNTLRPGDSITVKGYPARDATRQVWGLEVREAGTGAQVFQAKLNPQNVLQTSSSVKGRAVPRWPDGHPALGALPGTADGYWTNPSKTALQEDGVDVKMDEYGVLANIGDAAKVAPMQPWALGLYRDRQERQLRDDPMFLNCKPPGGVRQYQSRLGIQLLEDRQRKRIFTLLGSGNHNYHIIYMDGRKPVGLVGGDDDNPLYYGRSVGKWDGDTLVVETTGFNEDFWFTNGGLPHTSDLHLTERFTRTSQDSMRYEVKVEDPGAYTRPWSASWTMQWNGGATLPSFFCQNNRQ